MSDSLRPFAGLDVSARLRAHAATMRRDPARTRDAATLADCLARRGIPPWPVLFEFEARFGGIVLSHGAVIGVWTAVSDPRIAADPPLLRVDPQLHSDDDRRAHIAAGAAGTWLVRVGVFDRDDGLYADRTGRIYLHRGLIMRAWPAAEGMQVWFERDALAAAMRAGRRATGGGDHFVEVSHLVGADLAAALALPLVPEASCSVCTTWSDGALEISDGVAFGDPLARATCIVAVDDERALGAAVRAARLAGRRATVKVVGWPNPTTADFARALADRGVACAISPPEIYRT